MSAGEWSLIVGAILSIALAVCPWMAKVHSKLAVIASKIVDLCEKMDDARDEHRRLWEMCNRHQSRLDTHEVKLTHIAERLRGE